MTFQVFLSEKAQRDLDSFSDKIANQILTDRARLAGDPIPDGKRIKKLQGFKESLYRLRAGDFGFKVATGIPNNAQLSI